ncbi:hypothetical protein PQX77_021270 [Marasmius sp. AFHP31]|nr:hypothetical protein PQX77_021270 [Marasmius sp. AFHP31]
MPCPLTPDNLLQQQLPTSVAPLQSTQPPAVQQTTQGLDSDSVQPSASKKQKKVPAKQQTCPIEKADKEPATKGRGRTKEASTYSNNKMQKVVWTATEHPTSNGEWLQIYEDVPRAKEATGECVALGDLQDDSDQEDKEDVINISSGDDEEPSANVKKEKTKGKGKEKEKQNEKKGTTVTKAYCTEPPLPPPRKHLKPVR